MASSLSSNPFLGSSRTEGFSRFSYLSTDISKLSFSAAKISVGPRNAKNLQIKAAGSTFGNYFRVTTYGESHGGGVGCVIDGCPPRRPISEADLQVELDRRRPGQSRITTPRKETDTCRILSGVVNGVTTGTPIHVFVPNTDQRGHDYSEMSVAYRPSHADATYDMKYGIRVVEGGGRSSARETIGRVAAGAVAKKILKELAGTEVLAYVSQVYKVVLPEGVVDHETLSMEQIESNIVRCPDPEIAEKMIAAIDDVRLKGESIGGVVTCIVKNCPPGLGSPVFDKLEAELAKAVLSLPASKGFEIGSGFGGTFLTGSEHNDPFYLDENGRIRTVTNRSGGIQGGISNGEIITMRVAFKPTATIGVTCLFSHELACKFENTTLALVPIFVSMTRPAVIWMGRPVLPLLVKINGESTLFQSTFFTSSCMFFMQKKQSTVTRDKKEVELITRGRHDPCVVPRAVPMVEAMVALVLVDQLMAQHGQCNLFPINPDLQSPIEPKREASNTPV